ncbi:MAG: hypothetical protein ACYDHZ_00570 [Dehalococcoidia bacterium]
MTKNDWLQLAHDNDLKAREAYKHEDIRMAHVYEQRADAARECATLAEEREDSCIT